MRTRVAMAAAAIVAAATVACSGVCRPGRCLTASSAPTSVEAQRACGAASYAANCARCHGACGQGTSLAPPLVGACSLPRMPRGGSGIRTREIRTAMDVVGFSSAKMPPSPGARLPKEDYFAIVAYLLSERGVALREPLAPGNAESIVLNP
jgi:cytochrome c